MVFSYTVWIHKSKIRFRTRLPECPNKENAAHCEEYSAKHNESIVCITLSLQMDETLRYPLGSKVSMNKKYINAIVLQLVEGCHQRLH